MPKTKRKLATKNFEDIEIGQRFIWEKTQYVKTKKRWLLRYGLVNASGPAAYEGDTGERTFHAGQKVECYW